MLLWLDQEAAPSPLFSAAVSENDQHPVVRLSGARSRKTFERLPGLPRPAARPPALPPRSEHPSRAASRSDARRPRAPSPRSLENRNNAQGKKQERHPEKHRKLDGHLGYFVRPVVPVPHSPMLAARCVGINFVCAPGYFAVGGNASKRSPNPPSAWSRRRASRPLLSPLPKVRHQVRQAVAGFRNLRPSVAPRCSNGSTFDPR